MGVGSLHAASQFSGLPLLAVSGTADLLSKGIEKIGFIWIFLLVIVTAIQIISHTSIKRIGILYALFILISYLNAPIILALGWSFSSFLNIFSDPIIYLLYILPLLIIALTFMSTKPHFNNPIILFLSTNVLLGFYAYTNEYTKLHHFEKMCLNLNILNKNQVIIYPSFSFAIVSENQYTCEIQSYSLVLFDERKAVISND